MSKEKVKTFLKENWKVMALNTGLVVVGGIIGSKLTEIKFEKSGAVWIDDASRALLEHVDKTYDGIEHIQSWFANTKSPYKPEDLGMIGEVLKSFPDYTEGDSYTHFLIFGKTAE